MSKHLLTTIGLLRCVLYVISLTIMALSFLAAGETHYDNWRTIPTIVAPTLVPIVFFVLLLDVLMSLIFRADAKAATGAHYNVIITINLLLVCLLVLSWYRFFIGIFSI